MTKVLENIWSWWSENVKKCVIWEIREAYVCKSSKMLFLGYWVDEECERVQSGGSGGDGHPQGPARWVESLEEPRWGLRGHRGESTTRIQASKHTEAKHQLHKDFL